VEYCAKSNKITGLSLPFSTSTGMPLPAIEACLASDIFYALENFERSSTVQVILAIPNHPKSKPFLFGIYSTCNKFKATDVVARMKYMKQKLNELGINVLLFGSDGDSRFILAQKILGGFGNFSDFHGMTLAGNIDSQFLASQDPYHISKKLKNIMFDMASNLRIGNYNVTLSFLYILIKKFPFEEHGLRKSDLDHRDRMNYK